MRVRVPRASTGRGGGKQKLPSEIAEAEFTNQEAELNSRWTTLCGPPTLYSYHSGKDGPSQRIDDRNAFLFALRQRNGKTLVKLMP